MALSVDPVFMYPESSVMCLVVARSLRMSIACSPSDPVITGNSYSTPSRVNLAVSPMGGHDSRSGRVAFTGTLPAKTLARTLLLA